LDIRVLEEGWRVEEAVGDESKDGNASKIKLSFGSGVNYVVLFKKILFVFQV
jgi:hypothetical protein